MLESKLAQGKLHFRLCRLHFRWLQSDAFDQLLVLRPIASIDDLQVNRGIRLSDPRSTIDRSTSYNEFSAGIFSSASFRCELQFWMETKLVERLRRNLGPIDQVLRTFSSFVRILFLNRNSREEDGISRETGALKILELQRRNRRDLDTFEEVLDKLFLFRI